MASTEAFITSRDISEEMAKRFTITVTVRKVTMRILRLKIWIAIALIRPAAKTINCGLIVEEEGK